MDQPAEQMTEPYLQETNWGLMKLHIDNNTHKIILSFSQQLIETAEESTEDLNAINSDWFIEGDVAISSSTGDIIHDFDRVQQILVQANKDNREKSSSGIEVQVQIIDNLSDIFQIDSSGLRLPADNP